MKSLVGFHSLQYGSHDREPWVALDGLVHYILVVAYCTDWMACLDLSRRMECFHSSVIDAVFAYIDIDPYLAALAFQHWISGSSGILDYSLPFAGLGKSSVPFQDVMKSYCSCLLACSGYCRHCIELAGYYIAGVD